MISKQVHDCLEGRTRQSDETRLDWTPPSMQVAPSKQRHPFAIVLFHTVRLSRSLPDLDALGELKNNWKGTN